MVSRSFLVGLLICLWLGIATSSQAQESVREGMVRIELTSAAASQMAVLFAPTRPADDPTFEHSDIHLATVADFPKLQALLELPDWMHGATLAPWIPTHSVAFPDIRVRSNPQLFQSSPKVSGMGLTVGDSALRSAEDRLSRWFVLRFDTRLRLSTVEAMLQHSPAVQMVEPISIRRPCYQPNDTLLPLQYALPMMRMFDAWQTVRCDSTMLIADVDIGTDWTHPDLAQAIYLNQGEIGIDDHGVDKRANGIDDDHNGFVDDWHGWDFDGKDGASPDNDASATGSHGTHTAGIMCATGNDTIGIAGVAFGAKLLPIKASDQYGQSIDFGFAGIVYAADMHAKVVNCSWGGPTRSQAEQDVIDYATAKDLSVVAAAGNNGIYQYFYPASYEHVLSVGALDQNGTVASFTNTNPSVDVAAPGVDVLSTVVGGGYTTMTGTSMASPDAAGVVALVRMRFPNLTCTQAEEQVRATTIRFERDSGMGFVVDSARYDYVGRGAVDAQQAVTDTNEHSARLEAWSIADSDHNEELTPGETAGIQLRVRNYLRPVQNLVAHIRVVSGQDAVQILTPTVSFGAIGTLQDTTNDPAAFQLRVADSVGLNTTVTVQVSFSDSSVGYDADPDYFQFVIHPDYLDLNANNLTATFSSKGTLGYNDVTANSQGQGFQWREAPVGIVPDGKSVLYQGGLLIGTDVNHVVDAVQGNSDFAVDHDFQPLNQIHYVTPDHSNALQQLDANFDDAGADSANHIGIEVEQHAYNFGDGLAKNAVVVQYILRLPPDSTTTLQLAAGIFADWDIGLSGALNVTSFDSTAEMAESHRLESGYPWVGVKLLRPYPAQSFLNFHAIRNDGTEGDINTYDGFGMYEKWLALTEWNSHAGPGDISNCLSLANFKLDPGDADTITAVIAMATSEAELETTMAQTANAWNGVASVAQPQLRSDLDVFPQPAQRELHLSLPTTSRATVRISDMIGRDLGEWSVKGSSITIPLTFPAGIYIVTASADSKTFVRRIVVE